MSLLLALANALLASLPATPQEPCDDVLIAYVEPLHGCDTSALIGAPKRPFQRLQAAIDALSLQLQSEPPTTSGLVIANPGIYGPGGFHVNGGGDTFPIEMKDRVSVQGVGARRCILRGTGQVNYNPFWPVLPTCAGSSFDLTGEFREVLVDYSFAVGQPDDHEEFLDGFTLQGGDVQVYFSGEGYARGRISNCVFDMLPLGNQPGPFFGIELVHVYFGELGGQDGTVDGDKYFDAPFNIFNNTFLIWADGGVDELGAYLPARSARPEAVAIIDVSNPLCGVLFEPDPDPTLRGVGNPFLANNLVRTAPATTPVILLGIDGTDTQVVSGSFVGETNAFPETVIGSAVGGSNGTFFSALYDNVASSYTALLPRPRVNLLSGDPAFVGELLAGATFGLSGYRDWRILESSSMRNRGSHPLAPGVGLPAELVALNGSYYREPACSELSSFDWDMENYGNARVFSGEVDIGADESAALVMAGSYHNDDNSHNFAPGLLNPNIGDSGRADRFMIVPARFTGEVAALKACNRLPALLATPIVPPPGACPGPSPRIPAWRSQDGTFMPPRVATNPAIPAEFAAIFVDLRDPAMNVTWNGTVSSQLTYTSPVGTTHRFCLFDENPSGPPPTVNDVEPQVFLFNSQLHITVGGLILRSNLQSEFR